MQLPMVAQNDSRPLGKRVYRTSNLNLSPPQVLQAAHLFAVLSQAHDRKSTSFIWSLRAANIQNSRAIGQLHDVINVRANAHILVQMPPGFQPCKTRPLRAAAGL
jgi:hypothetical protein